GGQRARLRASEPGHAHQDWPRTAGPRQRDEFGGRCWPRCWSDRRTSEDAVRSELWKRLIALERYAELPHSQPVFYNRPPCANTGWSFGLRSWPGRRGDTLRQGRGNVLLDSMGPTWTPPPKKRQRPIIC